MLDLKDWLEQFSGWLCLIHDAYVPELKEAISSVLPIRHFRNHDQNMRSKRLFHLLQQNFSGYSKIENLIKSQISAVGITESNGFELLRVIRKEFSLLSRSEALGYREQCVKFRVKKTDHLPDVMREVQTEIDSFHSMLEASVIADQLSDVRISEGDQFLLYMRNLPGKVQEFLQLHQNATTVRQLFVGVQDYYIRTRVQGDMGSIHVTQPVPKPDVRNQRSAVIAARRVMLQKIVGRSIQTRSQKRKAKLSLRNLLEKTRSPQDVELAGAKVEEEQKDVEKETSFVELMKKTMRMIKIMMTMRKRTRVMITQSLKLIPVVVDR